MKKSKSIMVDGIEFVPASQQAKSIDGLEPVLIRSYGSGVHFGLLESSEEAPSGTIVTLRNSRRIYYWKGAATCSQIAMDGISNESKVCMEIPTIRITQAIEIIPLTEVAFENLKNMDVWKV
jgi:hypothetical protein